MVEIVFKYMYKIMIHISQEHGQLNMTWLTDDANHRILFFFEHY